MATVSATPLTVVPAPASTSRTASESSAPRPWVAPTVVAAVGAAVAALGTWWAVASFPLSMTVGGPGM